jgi:hypothetical protein
MNRRSVNPKSRDRDAGLARIKKLTRWSLAGALTGTGLFAGLAAHATASSGTTTVSQSTATSSGSKSTTSTSAAANSGSSATAGTSATTTTTVAPSSAPATIVSGAS